MFEYVDAALLRAATHPLRTKLPPWPDPDGSTEDRVSWLRQVCALDSVREGIELASPVLGARLRSVCEGQETRPRRVRRAVTSVLRYLLRMTSRATPFGLFAGVAPAHLGVRTAVRWGVSHRAVARVDSQWLSEVVHRLEGCSELLLRVPLVANNTSFVRDGRLFVPCDRHPGGADGDAPVETSMRYTRTVAAAVTAARTPVVGRDLVDKLAAEFPHAARAVLDSMTARLAASSALISALHAPMTVTDPLAHLLRQLDTAEADDIPQVADLVDVLRTTHATLTHHNAAPPPEAPALRATTSERMRAVHGPVTQPMMVDLRLDCDVTLPTGVLREAEAAATALARLTPHPAGYPAWRDYHARFLERYGPGARVPLRDLVDADTGLGLPAGYRGSLATPASPRPSSRDKRLLALAQRAAMDGAREIALDEALLTDLTGSAAEPRTRPHVELCFHLEATTPEALDKGDFTLVVDGAPCAAGVMTGRFLHALTPADQARFASAYAALPTDSADALPVQVSAPPLYQRTDNVARAPKVLPAAVHLAEHPTPGTHLPLEDLAVTGDAERLHLISQADGRSLEPNVLNAVELSNHTHPLARFLCDLTRAWSGVFTSFDWGTARGLPFLPRLRIGRSVLAPACWNLTDTDLPSVETRRHDWVQWLQRRYRLPDIVQLAENDFRLRLDLRENAHSAVLLAHLRRTSRATLSEAPDAAALGWLDGHAHEIVVPLASTRSPGRAPHRRRGITTGGREHGHIPGAGPYLFAKLYGHPDRQTQILTACLPELLRGWDTPPRWWYVRYRDPEPHLRLRFRLPNDEYEAAARRLGAWSADLRRQGLISHMQVDTYFPETGRYGAGDTMAAAEEVFASDSAAALAELTHGRVEDAQAVTAASLTDLAIAFTGDTYAGMRWLIDHIPPSGPAVPRSGHATAVRLADARNDFAALRARPGGVEIAELWRGRRAALAAYRNSLDVPDAPEVDSVLASLLHLHCVRVDGIDEQHERVCHRLARASALSQITRRGAKGTHP